MRKHALERIAECGLNRVWVERVALQPESTEADPKPGIRP